MNFLPFFFVCFIGSVVRVFCSLSCALSIATPTTDQCTGSENAGGVYNVSVHNFTCQDSARAILLKDSVPKHNMHFSQVVMRDIMPTSKGSIFVRE